MQQFFCVDQWTLESIKCQKIVTNTFYLFPEANVTSCLTCFTQKAEEVKKKIMLGISAWLIDDQIVGNSFSVDQIID